MATPVNSDNWTNQLYAVGFSPIQMWHDTHSLHLIGDNCQKTLHLAHIARDDFTSPAFQHALADIQLHAGLLLHHRGRSSLHLRVGR